jgi:hypothetical protein
MVRKHESRLCSCNGVKELPHNACLQKMLCKFRMSYFLQEHSCILEIALNSESKPLCDQEDEPRPWCGSQQFVNIMSLGSCRIVHKCIKKEVESVSQFCKKKFWECQCGNYTQVCSKYLLSPFLESSILRVLIFPAFRLMIGTKICLVCSHGKLMSWGQKSLVSLPLTPYKRISSLSSLTWQSAEEKMQTGWVMYGAISTL